MFGTYVSVGLSVFLLAVIAVVLVGPRRTIKTLVSYWKLLSNSKRILVQTAVLALLIPTLGTPYVDLKFYGFYVVSSALCFLSVLLFLSRFERLATWIFEITERYNVYVFSGVFLVLTSAAAVLFLEDIPHISDEVIYQFQAKAFANGRLYFDPPPVKEFFTFVHSIADQEKWYGILNPGWPAILALGYTLGVPWLVNPVLGALTLLFFFYFYKAAGYGSLETRIAVLLLGISPFVFFMSANYMAHAANLCLFSVFCWASAKLLHCDKVIFAIAAGLALGLNLLVRPIDSAVTATPFLFYLLFRTTRDVRWFKHLCVVAGLASFCLGVMFLYNHHLTGAYLDFPMSKYFREENLGKFGLGFGADVGTKLHGPEWPGYYPSDAIRVSSYRISELLQDFNGFPLLLLTACLYAIQSRSRAFSSWHTVLLTSALGLVAVYALHFYHGIAFGSRHYYLAVPALAIIIAKPMAELISQGHASVAYSTKVVFVALILHTFVFPYPILIRRYGAQYRGASASIRDYVAKHAISNAVIFVDGFFNWKSVYSLNAQPLESNSVIFARNLGVRNQLLLKHFPGRTYYHLKNGSGGITLETLALSART
jgi:hypothetical protein